MKEKEIIKMYVEDDFTLRQIAIKFSTNHKLIGRILIRNGIAMKKSKRLRVFTVEHKGNLSKSRKSLYESGKITAWSKGKKMTREHTLKNMKAHLKYDVTLEWLDQFPDIEKLKYLNRSISRKRDCFGFDAEIYKAFIERFYFDKNFNRLFGEWISTGDKWIKPSLDHIVPKSSGGILMIENLRFISWLENRSKSDIPESEWVLIKNRINEYF